MCSTPSRSEYQSPLDTSTTNTFSPVIVPQSPVIKTPQRGNLTGHPRKVRDSAADVFNKIQEWNAQHLLGVKILNNIVTLKNSHTSDSEMNVQQGEIFPEGLQEQCDHLDEVCNKMKEVTVTLEVIVQQLNALVDLERFQKVDPTPMFLTWPTSKFGEVCGKVCDAYKHEYEVKYCIKQNVAHSKTKANLMIHIAAWVHQPFINSDTSLALESLLHETGHRSLQQ